MPFSEIEMATGTTLSYSTTAGGSYTSSVGVRSITLSMTRPRANVTALADTETVKKPKRKDHGTIATNNVFQKTQYAALFTLWSAGTDMYWKITTPGGSVAGPFFGGIGELGLAVEDDEGIMFPMTIENSGGGSTPAIFTP